MQLTDEQKAIIGSNGNIKINAVAGSGKTTTIIEYASSRPKDSKILYLAFNKSVRIEALKRFSDKGLTNVTVETAHSIAYRYTVPRFSYKIRSQDYRSTDVIDILGLNINSSEKHDIYVIANHILKLVACFCNSEKEKVSDLHYIEMIQDNSAKEFVSKHFDIIELQARTFLAKMNRGEIEVTHDFYLKRFQLMRPQLNYDYILFDEGQDASAAMLDVFLNQNAIKVIVGDTHQQIYAWRYAVNSLEKVKFPSFQLSTSFRFSNEIAKLADEILKRKKKLGTYIPVKIKGAGKSTDVETKAVLARTNLGLLMRAIETMNAFKDLGPIYFEGNINSYMYADEGTSLYDILNLYNGDRKNIRDKLIKNMKNIVELEDYIEKTEDAQLGMMLEIVKEYGNKIPGLIKRIKEKHVENNEKEKASLIFSTIHRCKGLEYDVVQLVDDFFTEEKLNKLVNSDKNEQSLAKLNEEINLLYVAVTRARNQVIIPFELLPEEIPASYRIRVIRSGEKEYKDRESKVVYNPISKSKSEKSKSGKTWTEFMDEELTTLYLRGEEIDSLSEYFSRSRSAIQSRLKKLGLWENLHN